MTKYHPLTKKSSASNPHLFMNQKPTQTTTFAAISPNSDQKNHLSSSHTSTKSHPHFILHLHAHSVKQTSRHPSPLHLSQNKYHTGPRKSVDRPRESG